MFRFNFGRKVRRVARRQYRRGIINHETYKKIKDGSRDSVMVQKWQNAVEQQVPGAPWLRKGDFDWAELLQEIWDWLLENWPTILQIILSLLVFIEPQPQPKKKIRIVNKGRKDTSPRFNTMLNPWE
jgi:hypothetical protein